MSKETNLNEEGIQLTQEQFGREAEKYITSKVHASKSDLDLVKKLINPQKTWIVLDIATGTGHLALKLAPHVKNVIASDITQKMLDQAWKGARERGIKNFETKFVDVHNIPFDAKS
jgi:ubiquinone/menaquinone biosynthesis C-methylase UbiE